jgi:hypothetical protein
MSEAAKHKEETFERYIRPALADERGWADFPTTPEGFNWLYQLWRLGQDPTFAGQFESWRNPSWDNPHVYPGGREDPEIVALERTTDPIWFAQEIGADFASFMGKIYAEFDETKHVTDLVFNPDWPNYISFDWGFVNPLAAIEFQVTPWDQIRIWREHYKSYWRLEQHIDFLKQRDQPDGYHLDLAFGDAEDPEAAVTVSEKLVGCYALPEAKSNWREGIDQVHDFLRLRHVGEADEYGTPLEEPGLLVDRNCINVVSEFNNYRKQSTGTSDPNESGKRGGAQKIDDHAMDAIRYGLMHLYKLGVNFHLSDLYSSSDFDTEDKLTDRGYFTTEVSF